MEVMQLIEEIGTPGRAETIILEKLANKVKIPGFGHRVYRCEDPRVDMIREQVSSLTSFTGEKNNFAITQEIEKVVLEQTKVFPNVDLYTAALYSAMGLPPELFTPIFAISRTVGWTSHIMEQWGNNRLIRPRAEYIGPTNLHYTDIGERSR